MFIEVLVELKQKSVDRFFTYHVPTSLVSQIVIGKRVSVPFGNQTLSGYIMNINVEHFEEAKDILEVIDEDVLLTEELINLGHFMKESTLASLSASFATMLPVGLKARQKETLNKKTEKILRLTIDLEEAFKRIRGNSQTAILNLFYDAIDVPKTLANKISASSVQTLLKNEILSESEREVYRYQIGNQELEEKKELTIAQKSVYEKIEFNKQKTFLLHGITGAGKTEIYMQWIEEVLKQNKTAIVLVPEISLTAQFINRFIARFGSLIAVLHSGLGAGEKYDEWRKISRKEAQIVIGARSCIFAPLENIGIIIMDEEHADSYKQENTPKYHTLEIAKQRSSYHQCPLVLGSATPTLETMSRAKKGVYTYLSLQERASGGNLPECVLVDMKEEQKKHNPIISELLENNINDRLVKKEQIMILLNRRGFSTVIQCSSCGFTFKCPNCDITLTYHKSSKNLRCHYCGFTKYITEKCPECEEEALTYLGLGTEKLENVMKEKFPNARIIRMDADTTSRKGSHEKIVTSFQKKEFDILIGTQMISKGLDFPDVTLVGIINTDAPFQIPDFRSGEKAFSLLYQASGRSGRSQKPGSVILQTYNPDNKIIQYIMNQDYLNFYEYEMSIRKKLKYPPYYFIVNLKVKGADYETTLKEATNVGIYLRKKLNNNTIVLGPTTSNLFRINNIYTFEIMIKYRFDEVLIPTLKDLDQIFLTKNKVRLEMDLNY